MRESKKLETLRRDAQWRSGSRDELMTRGRTEFQPSRKTAFQAGPSVRGGGSLASATGYCFASLSVSDGCCISDDARGAQ